MKTKTYLFKERGITDFYFCGNIYQREPSDEIKIDGDPITFRMCVDVGLCLAFDTYEEAKGRSKQEEEIMQNANEYANNAMECESVYGMEGVDDMRYEFE